jgi:methylated-DNA-[protein]-cysteine S-methyltransferase
LSGIIIIEVDGERERYLVAQEDLSSLLAEENHQALLALARQRSAKILRYLSGRLYSADEKEKWRAVAALGAIVSEREIISRRKVADLLRRFFWAMNDESGAVPYGIPEAIGQILAQRPEFQDEFLPVLCSMLTHEDMIQTGPIERGVVWALGQVGPPVATCSQVAVKALRQLSWSHPEAETRNLATWALSRIEAEGE